MKLILKPGLVLHRKIAWLLAFSVLTLAMVSWLIYTSERSLERTSRQIDQTHAVIGIAQQTLLVLPQSGQPITAGINPTASASLDSLQKFAAINNDQPRNMALLAKYIQAYSTTGSDKAALTGSIRHLVSRIGLEETHLLASRKRIDESLFRKIAFGLVLGRFGAFLFVVIILLQLNRDISRRKKTQEQLVRAIGEAQQAKLLQEQFLANMSHEIRTPMNGIKGMTDLLLVTPLTEKQHELAGIIKNSANNLLVIINDILDFSKIQAGKLNIEKIDFRLKDTLSNTLAIFEHRFKKKGLFLKSELDPLIPPRLIGDPHRLNQVLTNLLGNALKFTEKGGIQLQVALQERSESGLVLHFTVMDTGIGIPAESLSHIFDSFSQAGRDISRRYGGTGLGLTICKQLLHLQGGDIDVTSQPGQGSSFHFYLPFGISDKPEAALSATAPIQDYSNLLTGKSFLVAEDNEINQKLIDHVLRKAGASVEIVNNGAEAIRVLENGALVDLIIMDLQMPEMDGYAATKYIRNDLHMDTPIIAMTATAMKGEQIQCLQSGMNEYMTKPFEFAELYQRISNLLALAG